LLLTLFFIVAVWVTVALNPALGPRGPKFTFKQKMLALKGVWSVVALFVFVMGGLYSGVFTATESAGIGAMGAFAFAVARRKMNVRVLLGCLVETGKTTAMIFTIIFGALAFANFITLTGMTGQLVDWIQQQGFSVYGVLISMCVIYLVLGCLMEAMGLMLLTVPMFTAVAVGMGVNPIWFGIFVTVMIEIGMLTPPVGMNVFTVKTQVQDVSLATIFRGVMPFLVANLALVGCLIAWPSLALIPLKWFG
jgi:C4-dicarboxylate transporter DctM subunit